MQPNDPLTSLRDAMTRELMKLAEMAVTAGLVLDEEIPATVSLGGNRFRIIAGPERPQRKGKAVPLRGPPELPSCFAGLEMDDAEHYALHAALTLMQTTERVPKQADVLAECERTGCPVGGNAIRTALGRLADDAGLAVFTNKNKKGYRLRPKYLHLLPAEPGLFPDTVEGEQ